MDEDRLVMTAVSDNAENHSCHDCTQEIIPEDVGIYYNDTNEGICQECSDNNYCSCDDCDDILLIDEAYYFDGSHYCDGCYEEQVCVCPSCDNELYRDDAFWSDTYGDYLCESCYEEQGSEEFPEWDVYSNEYVTERSHFVNPERDFYSNDKFHLIKSKRYVGLEIETNFKTDVHFTSVENSLNRTLAMSERDAPNGVDLESLGRSAFVHDGSVTNSRHPHGGELVMRPRRGDIVISDAGIFCEELENKWDAYASWKTGLHLHIDIADHDWIHASVLTLFTKLMEPHIYCWLPKSRHSGNGGQRWSRPVSQSVFDFKYISDRDSFINFYYDNGGYTNEKYNDKRYHGLNWHSHFQGNQGLEIRYHSGTLQKEKIKHWTIFWTQVVDKSYYIAEQIKDEMISHSDFGDTNLFKSLVGSLKIRNKINDMNAEISRGPFSGSGQSMDVFDYRKKSEILRRYLGLPKKDRPYLLHPMLFYLKNRANRAVMSLENIFDVFEIETETQKFYKNRKEQIRNSMEEHIADSHYNDVFRNIDSIVEFDKNTLQFKYKDIFKDSFHLVNDVRSKPYNEMYQQKTFVDYGLLRQYSSI